MSVRVGQNAQLERCPVGHSITEKTEINEILSIATDVYFCKSVHCGYYLFCKICNTDKPTRNVIIPENISGFVMNHMVNNHKGMKSIIMNGYRLTFPEYFVYLRTSCSYNELSGNETIDETMSIMDSHAYSCIICKSEYDCLPSKEVVISHANKCICASRCRRHRFAGCAVSVSDTYHILFRLT